MARRKTVYCSLGQQRVQVVSRAHGIVHVIVVSGGRRGNSAFVPRRSLRKCRAVAQ